MKTDCKIQVIIKSSAFMQGTGEASIRILGRNVKHIKLNFAQKSFSLRWYEFIFSTMLSQ